MTSMLDGEHSAVIELAPAVTAGAVHRDSPPASLNDDGARIRRGSAVGTCTVADRQSKMKKGR